MSSREYARLWTTGIMATWRSLVVGGGGSVFFESGPREQARVASFDQVSRTIYWARCAGSRASGVSASSNCNLRVRVAWRGGDGSDDPVTLSEGCADWGREIDALAGAVVGDATRGKQPRHLRRFAARIARVDKQFDGVG